ncbi:hypothetical protein ACHAXR_009704 [Thalassiosira sp. AJA248-18]
MSYNILGDENSVDEEEVLRCSYENAMTMSHSRKDDDFFEEDLERILRCSYEYDDENDVLCHRKENVRRIAIENEPLTAGHQPALAAVAEQQDAENEVEDGKRGDSGLYTKKDIGLDDSDYTEVHSNVTKGGSNSQKSEELEQLASAAKTPEEVAQYLLAQDDNGSEDKKSLGGSDRGDNNTSYYAAILARRNSAENLKGSSSAGSQEGSQKKSQEGSQEGAENYDSPLVRRPNSDLTEKGPSKSQLMANPSGVPLVGQKYCPLEREIHAINLALQGCPQYSQRWLEMHSKLERAREELHTVRHAIEIDSKNNSARISDCHDEKITPLKSNSRETDIENYESLETADLHLHEPPPVASLEHSSRDHDALTTTSSITHNSGYDKEMETFYTERVPDAYENNHAKNSDDPTSNSEIPSLGISSRKVNQPGKLKLSTTSTAASTNPASVSTNNFPPSTCANNDTTKISSKTSRCTESIVEQDRTSSDGENEKKTSLPTTRIQSSLLAEPSRSSIKSSKSQGRIPSTGDTDSKDVNRDVSSSPKITSPPSPSSHSVPSHQDKQDTPTPAFCPNLSNPYNNTSKSQPRPMYNGWNVPLGVHKVICSAPGMSVSTHVHRGSRAVKIVNENTQKAGRDSVQEMEQDLIIPPGSYVEVLETQVHGERIRGRICWETEEEGLTPDISGDVRKSKGKKSIKKRTSRLLKRTSRKKRGKSQESMSSTLTQKIVKYEGWISLHWAKSEEGKEGVVEHSDDLVGGMKGRVTDEDSGPWTEPVPLGVYRITVGGGLPLRESTKRDSVVLGKLDHGCCVEVVQTQIKGGRVGARVIVYASKSHLLAKQTDGITLSPSLDEAEVSMKYTSGWISLLNALTGSLGASPIPHGAYVVVAESGCVITEGGRLDSKAKGTRVPGSCMEVVATRMEEGVVRGLIANGGHATLFALDRKNSLIGQMFAMPVPLGTYQIIQDELLVTTGVSSTSSIAMKLQLNATVKITETSVEDGRVRGRICARTSSGNIASGWLNLFDPNHADCVFIGKPSFYTFVE